jgi:Pumilio-family RNA binding repeat
VLVFGPFCRSGVIQTSSVSFIVRGRIVELACNCYGCHVLQKALDCEEEVRLLIVSELLLGDPAQTLVNKHASHVWSKVVVGRCLAFDCVDDLNR